MKERAFLHLGQAACMNSTQDLTRIQIMDEFNMIRKRLKPVLSVIKSYPKHLHAHFIKIINFPLHLLPTIVSRRFSPRTFFKGILLLLMFAQCLLSAKMSQSSNGCHASDYS
jgi:hypothetical protein